MRTSWLDRPWFYPIVVASFILGNAIDLFGTYLHQPNFEHEANWLYVTLKPYGLRLNWLLVIAGKTLICVLAPAGLLLFLRLRRRYYPAQRTTFRAFATHFLYGRPLGWTECNDRLPHSATPAVLTLLAIWCLGGPYLAYLGYGNLASKYGWRQLPGFSIGPYWIEWILIIWVPLSIAFLFWLLWDDFQRWSIGQNPSSHSSSVK